MNTMEYEKQAEEIHCLHYREPELAAELERKVKKKFSNNI
jgi:hypothetical protein